MISNTNANTIRSRFKTLISDVYSLTTHYDNQDASSPSLPWCRLSILDGETIQTEIGGDGANTYRTPGVMIAQLFYSLGAGDKDARIMAAHIESAFRSVSLTGLVFKTPYVRTVGKNQKNEWQVNVSCPFYTNEIG